MEENGESQQMLVEDSSPKEITKRWGFRRSTIARREFMEEIGNLDIGSISAPRRGARQARGRGRGRGRGKDAGEMPSTSPAPKRGRGGRRSAPANLAIVPSPKPTDGHTILELGDGDCADLGTTQQTLDKSAAKTQSSTTLEAVSDVEAVSEAAASDQAEDSDDLTLRELQERAKNRRKLEEASALSVPDLNLNTNIVNKDVEEVKTCLQMEKNAVQEDTTPRKASRTSKKDQKRVRKDEEEEQNEDADKCSHDSEENDPNALYCICRQKHNNRFMICCDRCQEWFHGDCVGISVARGRLLEENGEDYICPTCSPCQSPVDFMKQPALSTAALSSSSESIFSASAGEDRPSEDEGIRGKIRKAATRSAKRKFKIFQPVEVVAAVLGHEKEEKVKQEVAEEKAAVPKCIGPGCVNDALPESVYCGHQCIIRHAAVAMQSISEPKTEPQIQMIQTKPAPKPVPKIQKKTFLEKLFKRKLVEKPVKEEDGSSKKPAVSLETEEPVSAPLSSDPKPKAAGAQKSSAIAPSVFYKSTAVKTENEDVESKAETKQDAPQHPNPAASSDGPEKDEKTEKVDEKAASSAPPLRKPGSNPLPSRAKKTMPGSPRLAGLKQLQTEPPQVNKGTFTVPEKPCQSQEATAAPQDPTASSGQASEIRVLPVTPAPVPPPRPLQAHPNMQMRQNVRRSLTDTLMKRVTESDLGVSESDVGKLAVNIEREMFNMYYTTDSKYKNKYRTLLLSLKDPKNKGLFCQVIKGQITPFKLTRLSQQELQCVQVSQEIAATFLKEESGPVCVNTEELPSACEDKVVKTESTATSSEEKASASQVKPAQPRKVSTAVSDIISSMLKDTTSEHRAHLFDLKCRICTGQISADEDTDVKTFKKEELKDEEEEKTTPWVIQMFDKNPPDPAPVEIDPIMESPASPTADDSSVETTLSDFSPLVIPEVSVVSITRRDPRTASYRPAPSPSVAPTSAPPPLQCPPVMPTEKEAVEETKAVEPLPLPPPPPMPKSILMKPSGPSVPTFYSSSSSTTRLTSSHTPTENETSQFLSKQDVVWKGFLNMQTVAKFVTKGYLISGSGSAELLKKDLPDTIHIGGRILPQTVWEYVDKVKTSVTKEMSLIRFHPATDEEEVAYVSLFSYFNSRRRFGVVSNICNSIKDLYLIPLCAKESIPSVLLPLEGPGLEEQHPNLLIGLAICQKLKRLGPQTQEIDEKRPRIQMPLDLQGVTPTIKPAVPESTGDMSDPYDPDIPISTTPPGSPPDTRSPDSAASFSSSMSGPSVLSNILSVVNPLTSVSACTTKTTSSDLPPSSGAGTSSSTTPLQTILNTLFGKRKQDAVNTCEQSPSEVKELSVSSPTFDPIVQQYQQTPKNTVIEKMELDDNDRPYDPEEEYDQGIGYQSITTSSLIETSTPNPVTAVCEVDDDDRPYDPEEEYNLGNKVDAVTSVATKSSVTLPSVNTSAVNDDVAYDPEDETVFEEMQTYLADNKPSTSQYGSASTVSLSEQQKMLEELNRQIEEQKRQLEEQEEALRLQRAAVGVSMAHFSVSDALMSPPPRFGREPDDAAEKTSVVPLINPSRDPRQCKNVKQDAVCDNLRTVPNDKESSLKEISVRKQALTQATFLVPSNSSVMQDLSKPEQDLMLDVVKKNLDVPSVTLAEKMSTVEESFTNVNAKDLHSAVTLQTHTHLSASELEEGMYSSSGNENRQHSHSHSKVSGKSRQSRTCKWDNGLPKRQSRHDRRSRHEERSSCVSRDEADRYRRKDRHSPEQSSRRSRSHSKREERVSSRQRDRHHHRSTSRHRSRRDRHSTRSHLSRSGKSAQPKNDKSCQRDQSPSRQRTESVQQTQCINQTSSGPHKIQGDASQNEASEDGEQNLSEVPKEGFTKTENAQPFRRRPSDPPGAFSQNYKFSQSNENKPASGSLSAQRDHPDKDLKARYQNRDKREVLKDNFGQGDPSELPPQMDKSTFSNSQAESQSFQSGDVSQVEPDQCNENKAHPFGKNRLHRDDFPEDESDQFHHRNQPRSEHSLMLQSKDDQIHNIQDQRSNIAHDETAVGCQREQSFSSLQLQRDHSSGHEADHRKQLPQKTLQIQREDFSDYDKPYSRKSLSGHQKMQIGHFSNSDPDQCFNRDASKMHPSLGHRHNFPKDEAHQMHHNEDSPLMQRHNFAQDAVNQLKERNPPQRPPQIQRRDFTLDEACHNFSDSQNYADETDDSNTERYLRNFPVEETESGHQRGLPHRLPRLRKNDFHGPVAEQRDFKKPPKMPSQNQQGSFSVDEDEQLHIHDPLPQGAHSMRGDLSQGDPDIPRNFYPRDQFRLRAPGDAWRGPQQRNPGPRGPPSLMVPRCPTVVGRPRMPRAPHPQGFENCGPGPNFGPRGMYPRVRTFDDAGPSPNYGPRGPSSGPGITEGSEPQTFRPRGPNPVDNSPQNFGFKGRFPGPRNFGPRGSFSGPGPRPGLCRSQHVMDGPSGPFQPNHEKPRGPFNVRGPPRPDSREHGAPQQFDRETFDSESDFRGHAPPQQFDHRDSRPPGFHCSRDGTPTHPFDEEEIGDRGFLQQHTSETRRSAPPQHSDESNSHYQNSANESFSNSLEPRSCLQGRSRAQPGSLPNSQSEDPQFLEMESGMRASQQFSESGEQEAHKELGKPHFAKSDICESVGNPESDVQMKGPRFHSLQNFRGQRAPSPRFHGQRMPAPWNKELEEKPYSPRFPRKISPSFTHLQRPQGPTAGEIQSLKPQVMQPQVRFDGPPKEPDIRPLRLSGPLLPTPPGGPIRLPNPRMQRPYQEHNRPQGLPTRAHSAGPKPGRCDDSSSRPRRETSKGLIQVRQREELGNEGEDSSSQDSSPVKAGKLWRRRTRKREGRNRAARRQRNRERREGVCETVRDKNTERNTDNDQKA